MVEKHLTGKHFLRKHLEAMTHVLALLQYWFFIEFGLGSSWELLPEYLVYYVFMCLPIVFYANAFWLIPSFLRRKKWLVYVVLAMLLCSILGAIFLLLIMLANIGQTLLAATLASCIFLGFVTSFGYRFSKDWIVNIGVVEKLNAEKSAMELAFLKSQIDPHFLFNTLNSLVALALSEKGEKTADAIAKLGTLMRYNLHDSHAERISLEKEIDYLQKYIDLQQLRMSDNCRIEFNLRIENKDLQQLKIAPMLLMPIVENAFKFGVHPSESSDIRIDLQMTNLSLEMQVENTIVRKASKMESGGIGLQNVRNRLQLLYPGNHRLIAENRGNQFIVHLSIELT